MCYIYGMGYQNYRQGQTAVEYILLVVAVVLVLIAFLKPAGPFHKGIEATLFNTSIHQVNKISSEIKF